MNLVQGFTSNKLTKSLPVQQLDPIIKVTMPLSIYEQIQYLCSEIPKVEWSGVLFYSVKGDISSSKNDFEITLEDILPLDMGTSAYTSYELDDRYTDYLMENPIAMEKWKTGHIHSHNTMQVFFSGTDMDELNDNAPHHNYYLSLIVNNFMNFKAKLCYLATGPEKIDITYEALDSNGEPYVVSTLTKEFENKLLCIHECDVISPKKTITLNDSFKDKVVEIMKPKPIKTYNHYPNGKSWKNPHIPVLQDDDEDDYWNWQKVEQNKELVPITTLNRNALSNPNLNEDKGDQEIFMLSLLGFGVEPTIEDDIEILLDHIIDMQVDGDDLGRYFIKNFIQLYKQFFGDKDKTHYYETLCYILSEFMNVVDIYPILFETIGYLFYLRTLTEDEMNIKVTPRL